TRSIHELIWALLLVSVLGLDPLVAVLAIALPFGAQTAKVFAETLDAVPPGPLATLRLTGARPATAMGYALLPAAAPLLLSYSFYRFECAIRSVVVLGAVGVGGLGQELVVSLSSRNWDEVWTLIAAVLLLSAATDLWSSLLRADLAVVSCSDWSSGTAQTGRSGSSRLRSGARDTTRWARWSAVLAGPGLVVAWVASGASWSGLTSDRTRQLTGRLLDDLWPPQVPPAAGVRC
ncbi:MAG: ABC transporter permease subunit, partial [Actinomycetota bacterium]